MEALLKGKNSIYVSPSRNRKTALLCMLRLAGCAIVKGGKQMRCKQDIENVSAEAGRKKDTSLFWFKDTTVLIMTLIH